MKKFISFITLFFLLASLIIILLIGIFENSLFPKAAELIKNYIWPAAVALLVFLVLLSAGIVTNLHREEGSLLSNGYFQLAILELFLFSAGLAYLWHYNQQPGQIIFRLQPEDTKEYINLGLTYDSAGLTVTDTITAPAELKDRVAGKYRIETLDADIVYFHADVDLEPGEIETIVVPVFLSAKTLSVRSEPAGAEIWIDGLQTASTPYTFEISDRDTVILELKLQGYQNYVDTLSLTEDLDLGVIPLEKLYALRVSCRYPDIDYRIYDMDGNSVFAASGSRTVQLTEGRYKIAYGIGEGQYETKTFSLNRNYTVAVP